MRALRLVVVAADERLHGEPEQTEVGDPARQVADAFGRLAPVAALDPAAEDRLADLPDGVGEESGGQGHERHAAEGGLGDQVERALLVGRRPACGPEGEGEGEAPDDP